MPGGSRTVAAVCLALHVEGPSRPPHFSGMGHGCRRQRGAARIAAVVGPQTKARITTSRRVADGRSAGYKRSRMSTLGHIRSYYEALNTGDVELIASHFTDDATHYYTRLGPHHGREIAENARWATDNIDGRWWYEHGLADGDEAVIEWTMT